MHPPPRPSKPGPSNSKNSIICNFFPQAPKQHGGTKGKSSQVLGGCCLASELCYLCLVALANFLGCNSGNLKLLGCMTAKSPVSNRYSGPFSSGASPPAQSGSECQMQWKSGHVSELQVTSDAIILEICCLPKVVLPAQGKGQASRTKDALGFVLQRFPSFKFLDDWLSFLEIGSPEGKYTERGAEEGGEREENRNVTV